MHSIYWRPRGLRVPDGEAAISPSGATRTSVRPAGPARKGSHPSPELGKGPAREKSRDNGPTRELMRDSAAAQVSVTIPLCAISGWRAEFESPLFHRQQILADWSKPDSRKISSFMGPKTGEKIPTPYFPPFGITACKFSRPRDDRSMENAKVFLLKNYLFQWNHYDTQTF
ncbi:hypothetical protein NPIL_477281 [Nephila pilipes]|uniref:Uncharacterized protein n=1 Tax=Nephila pilipes TaxID=299642 RepID=A0A8X6PRJ7_NEPPI|nr:hypothetical protein NPIL_477281 [Nephila pilipes]